MKLFTDAEISRFLVAQAVAAMRSSLLLHAAGQLSAPPRLHAEGLTFTVGGAADVFGFRAYHTRDAPYDDQLVAVWNAGRQLGGVIAGSALGSLRTSVLGVVATDVLARPEASRLGLIGSGTQAKAHALAAATVRPLSQILIHSRDAGNQEKLAAELRSLGLSAEAAESAEQVCAESELLTLVTNSPQPVIEADWVRPGTHVCTLGSKEKGRCKFPPELAQRCALIVTDSPAQLEGYLGGHILSGTAVRALGECLQNPPPRRAADITLFLSVGLAGTEVLLARELLRSAQP